MLLIRTRQEMHKALSHIWSRFCVLLPSFRDWSSASSPYLARLETWKHVTRRGNSGSTDSLQFVTREIRSASPDIGSFPDIRRLALADPSIYKSTCHGTDD